MILMESWSILKQGAIFSKRVEAKTVDSEYTSEFYEQEQVMINQQQVNIIEQK